MCGLDQAPHGWKAGIPAGGACSLALASLLGWDGCVLSRGTPSDQERPSLCEGVTWKELVTRACRGTDSPGPRLPRGQVSGWRPGRWRARGCVACRWESVLHAGAQGSPGSQPLRPSYGTSLLPHPAPSTSQRVSRDQPTYLTPPHPGWQEDQGEMEQDHGGAEAKPPHRVDSPAHLVSGWGLAYKERTRVDQTRSLVGSIPKPGWRPPLSSALPPRKPGT